MQNTSMLWNTSTLCNIPFNLLCSNIYSANFFFPHLLLWITVLIIQQLHSKYYSNSGAITQMFKWILSCIYLFSYSRFYSSIVLFSTFYLAVDVCILWLLLVLWIFIYRCFISVFVSSFIALIRSSNPNFFVFCKLTITAFCYFPTGSMIDLSTLLRQSCKTLIRHTVVVVQSPADMQRPSFSYCTTAFKLKRTEFLSLHGVATLGILWLCICKDIMSDGVKHCAMFYNCHCDIWMNLYSIYDKVIDNNNDSSANTRWWMI